MYHLAQIRSNELSANKLVGRHHFVTCNAIDVIQYTL